MRLARLILPPAAVIACAMPALSASVLVPHRAVYDLALDHASDRSGITGIDGRMVYEFNGSACDGYTVTFRFVTRIETSDDSRLTDQQTTTFEDGEGSSFDFSTRTFTDNSLDRELRGSARIEDGRTRVALEKPEQRTLQLDETQFPTRHLLDLVERAEEGETFYETTIFDGSDEADRLMTTTVIIGKEAPLAEDDVEFEATVPLRGQPFWPVDIAYFDLSDDESGEELPTYRISFKLHENGVTRDLTMDYGEFSMSGRLVDLSLFDPPDDCTR